MIFAGSCDRISCPAGKHCLLDQNLSPHCVKCTKKCRPTPRRRQVCGSDGATYSSICHLREAACRNGKAIPLAYKGKCKGKFFTSNLYIIVSKNNPPYLTKKRFVMQKVNSMQSLGTKILRQA